MRSPATQFGESSGLTITAALAALLGACGGGGESGRGGRESLTALDAATRVAEAPFYSVIDLGPLEGSGHSVALAITDRGQVVGVSDGQATLFSTIGGPNIALGTLGGRNSVAFGINSAGQVVGNAQLAGDVAQRAALFSTTGGPNVDLGTLGGSNSSAFAINNRGQVVGWADTSDGVRHATLFSTTGGPNIDLDTLVSNYSYAYGINGRGQVVGNYVTSDWVQDPFIWDNGVMRTLDSLIDSASGWDLLDARGINDAGQIAAYGYNATTGQYRALLLSPTKPKQ